MKQTSITHLVSLYKEPPFPQQIMLFLQTATYPYCTQMKKDYQKFDLPLQKLNIWIAVEYHNLHFFLLFFLRIKE